MEQEIKPRFEDDLIENFKTEFIKTLQELLIKRQQLEEYRTQVAESIVRQHDLEHKLENEKRKNANDEFNNILMKNGNVALETERQNLSKELAYFKSRNDMNLAEKDSLYAETKVQALANLKLKETIQDLERKDQCHLQFQDDIKKKLDKTIAALKTIMPTIIKIQQKQENIVEIFDNMNKFNNLSLTLSQVEKLKQNAENERDLLENKYISENAECYKLRELLNNLSIKQTNEETKLTALWKEQAIYLQTQLDEEKERNQIIEKTLRVARENEIICRKTNDCNEDIETNVKEVDIERKIIKQMKDVGIQTEN